MTAASQIAPPNSPKSLSELGLNIVTMRDILIKSMFRSNLEGISDISRLIALPPPLTQELLDMIREQGWVEVTGTASAGRDGEMGFRLTDGGKERALDALAQSEYYGAMPVPLVDYALQIKQQSVRNRHITRGALEEAMGELILPDNLLDQLGPAVGAGRSILMYGPPGNGKSSISNGIRDTMGDLIFVPRAIEHNGAIISVYDPLMHVKREDAEDGGNTLRNTANRFDRRYVRCMRPTVITGGELTLDMLDLVYNPTSRTYQAPLQLKATGGVFIVDDLGRQEDPPQKLVNRWIVPLEESKDILSLQSGEKFEVPFDTLVIFSTNFHPNEIFDQAALRRIFYKIKIDGPDQENFLKIFAIIARKKRIPLDEDALVYLLNHKYPEIDHNYANYQPGFLIDQIISICQFEGIANQMTPDLIDRAWANLFVKDETIVR